MRTTLLFTTMFALALAKPTTLRAWDLFLDGSLHPQSEGWQLFVNSQDDTTTVVDFTDAGTNNQALRISTEAGANEWYLGPSQWTETAAGARFRLVDFSPTGKENLLCITTRSTLRSPAPSITLVDGRYKVWNYVDVDQEGSPGTEFMDLGPVVSNEWHTAYLWARNDGKFKLWWDGLLLFDGDAPLVNPYDGYMEWGCGSWQFDASTTAEFDWVGQGNATNLPIGVMTIPGNGASFHNAAEGFNFTVNSFEGVASNSIIINVNGVDRTGELELTGTEAYWQAHLGGLMTNNSYRVLLTVTDGATNTSNYTIDFQTFSQNNFQFEAEDWNFSDGMFLDTIVLSSVPGQDNYLERFDTQGVDSLDLDEDPGSAQRAYRSGSLIGTEVSGDVLRQKYLDAQATDPAVADYNVGWVNTGEWLNYTRTFPAGTYHLYGRLASGNTNAFEAAVDKVTGANTANQTLTPLGSFKGDTGHGWQFYSFIPLTDNQGQPVVLNLGGVETLRVTAVTNAYNANFYMLVPAAVVTDPDLQISLSAGNVIISWLTNVTAQLQSTPALVSANWTNNPAPVTVVNGRNTVTNELTGTAQFFRLQ